jgi:hypothetical protein
MKTLNWIAWGSLSVAALIILLATIILITGTGLFGFSHVVNFFHAANTFILFSIAIFLVVYRCDCKK